jgi:phosphatidylglycerophosphatase A
MSSSDRVPARAVFTDPFHFLAFGFGAGLVPYAPGTAGTVGAIPIIIALNGVPVLVYLSIAASMLLVGLWICGRASVALGVHDHSGIVWDEIVGYLCAMAAAPVGWRGLFGGFVLFRVFDILKPWPANLVDRRLGGGAGIMLDDTVAGIYSLLAIQAIAWLF